MAPDDGGWRKFGNLTCSTPLTKAPGSVNPLQEENNVLRVENQTLHHQNAVLGHDRETDRQEIQTLRRDHAKAKHVCCVICLFMLSTGVI
jgi:hypothetical protein